MAPVDKEGSVSVYREHIAPVESQDDYLVRIEREKRDDECRERGVVPVPLPVPAKPIMGLAMAPMEVPFA
jgi:hypothetical protein